MPFISIKVAGQTLTPEQVKVLQTQTTSLMAEVLHKKAELTAVSVEQVSPAGWSVGAKAVPVAAHLEATITAGTNSADEKARFIAEAAQMLKSVLGAWLPVATYIVLRDVPADSWGYDGLTQAARRYGAGLTQT
jgi:4-oxalocrotonate tautomerase